MLQFYNGLINSYVLKLLYQISNLSQYLIITVSCRGVGQYLSAALNESIIFPTFQGGQRQRAITGAAATTTGSPGPMAATGPLRPRLAATGPLRPQPATTGPPRPEASGTVRPTLSRTRPLVRYGPFPAFAYRIPISMMKARSVDISRGFAESGV